MSSLGSGVLRKLRRLGFPREQVLDDTQQLEIAYFARERPDVLGAALDYGDTDARAYRLRSIDALADPLLSPPPGGESRIAIAGKVSA